MRKKLMIRNRKTALSLFAGIILMVLIHPIGVVVVKAGDHTTIHMLPSVNIDNGPVFLGDVATIKGGDSLFISGLEQLVLGKAPLPGKSRKIDTSYVTLRLKQKGISKSRVVFGHNRVTTVYRTSTTLNRDQLVAVVRETIVKEDLFKGRRANIKEVRIDSNLVVPVGTISYRVEFPEKRMRSSQIPFSVSVFTDGKHYRKIWGTLVAEIFQEVIVLKHSMRRYQRITPEDIELMDVSHNRIPNNAITRDQDIVGKRVIKSLLSGTILRNDIVEMPPLVNRGDIVTIVASSGALQVTALGKVKNKGRKGDRIRVVNVDTHKEIHGLVVDAKTVQIAF